MNWIWVMLGIVIVLIAGSMAYQVNLNYKITKEIKESNRQADILEDQLNRCIASSNEEEAQRWTYVCDWVKNEDIEEARRCLK